MKNFHKALSILAAAALFAGCSSYDETNDPARAGNTSVKLLADVADDAETRAGISVGESTFTGYWEENDAMGILFTAARVRGIPARLLEFENEAHQVFKPQNSLVWNREFFGWLNKYVK